MVLLRSGTLAIGNLLTVASSGGGTNYFNVTASGISTSGTLTGLTDITYPAGASRNISIAQSASTTGDSLNLTAGQGATVGNFGGGNLFLQAGAGGGAALSGAVIVHSNGTNTTGAFQIQNAANTILFNVDTTTGFVGIGGSGTSLLTLTHTETNTTGAAQTFSSYSIQPASAPGAAATYNGISSVVTASGANLNANLSVYGVAANAITSGGAGITTGGAIGIAGTATNSGAGTLSGASGGVFQVQNTSSGNITLGNGVQVSSPSSGTGSIFVQNGVYIAAQKVTGVSTGYGINQVGSNDLNLFAGQTSVQNTSGTAFQIQTASGTNTLFGANTSTMAVSINNPTATSTTSTTGTDTFNSGGPGLPAQWTLYRGSSDTTSAISYNSASAGKLRITPKSTVTVNCYTGTIDCVRVLEAAPTTDFTVISKDDTSYTAATGDYPAGGIFMTSDATCTTNCTFIRFDKQEQSNSGQYKIIVVGSTAGVIDNGASPWLQSSNISNSTPMYIKVVKSSTTFTVSYSTDGVTYLTLGSFADAISFAGANAKIGMHVSTGAASLPSVDFDNFSVSSTTVTNAVALSVNGDVSLTNGRLIIGGNTVCDLTGCTTGGTSISGANQSLSNLTAGSVQINTDLTFAQGSNRTINVSQTASGVGNNLTLTAGQGATTGNQIGGNLVLQAGAGGGSGVSGSVVVKNLASQGTDLLELQSSGGTIFTRFDNAGSLFLNNGNVLVVGQDSAAGVNVRTTLSSFYPNNISLVVKGVNTQTGDLQQYQDNLGTVLSAVNSKGYLALGNGTATSVLTITHTETNTTGAAQTYSNYTVTPASAPGAITTWNGISSVVTATGANLNSNTYINGVSANAVTSGGAGITTGGTVGFNGSATNAGAGTLSGATGGVFNIQNTSTGAITFGNAIQAASPVVSGGSIFIQNGVYISAQKVSGVSTGYGLYQAGASDLNVFAGATSIQNTGTTAFVIQQASAGTALLTADTSAMKISVNNPSATAGSTVTTGTDTFNSGGPALAAGWTLYRGASDATSSTSYNSAAVGKLRIIPNTTAALDCYTGVINCVRVLESSPTGDFTAETKIDTNNGGTGTNGAAQGIFITTDATCTTNCTFLRVEKRQNSTSAYNIAIYGITAGAQDNSGTGTWGSSGSFANSAPVYIRVSRASNTWTVYFSFDGSSWSTLTSFTKAAQIQSGANAKIGPYFDSGAADPAYTAADFDYFNVSQSTATFATALAVNGDVGISNGRLVIGGNTICDSTGCLGGGSSSSANVTLSNLTAGATAINTDLTFGTGSDRNLNIGQSTTGVGNNLILSGGQGLASSNSTGGNLLLMAGAGGGSGSSGSVNVQSNLTNSTSAFQVLTVASAKVLSVDTSTASGRVVIGTGAVGQATAALLVLDSGTSASDPTGVNGSMYYNAVAGNFRCFENNAWRNCVSGLLGHDGWSVRGAGGTLSTTALNSVGLLTTIHGASWAPSNSTDAAYEQFTTNPTIGNAAGFTSATYNTTRLSYSPTCSVLVRTPNVLTASQRIYIGLGSAAPASSNDPGGSFVGFRFTNVAGDTGTGLGWRADTRNGTTNTVGGANVASSANVAVNTSYLLKFRYDSAASKLYLSVNGSAEDSVTTTLPASTTDLGAVLQVITGANTADSILVSRYACEQS
jgi:hypothetical protein